MTRKWVGNLLMLLSAAIALFVVTPAPVASADTVVIAPGFGRDEIGTTRRLGLGLEGGWPFSGLNLKYFASKATALQLTAGWGYYALGIKGEYLIHPAVLLQGPGLTIPFYLGPGVGIVVGPGYFALNPHLALGVAFQLRMLPLDFYAQLEPGVLVGPGILSFSPGAAGGVRWYF